MIWDAGLLVVTAGVAVLLFSKRKRQERQRRESVWEHLMSAVGHRQDSSGDIKTCQRI